jgi:hypothetical protein
VISSKPDSLLDVLWRSGIDANHWHVPLLTRNAEGGVEVATLDGPIGEGVRLVVGELGSARLIGTPDAVVPTGKDIGTAPCGGVVTRGGRRDRVDEWLRNFRCEGLELGIGRPTPRSRCTAAVLGGYYRCHAEDDSQKRREEKHDCPVRLGGGGFWRSFDKGEGIYRMNPTIGRELSAEACHQQIVESPAIDDNSMRHW